MTETKLYQAMLIKRGGKARHILGDISRDTYEAELIYVYDETKTEWIGRYAEGYGFINVHFAKKDCRVASPEEEMLCNQGKMYEIKF